MMFGTVISVNNGHHVFSTLPPRHESKRPTCIYASHLPKHSTRQVGIPFFTNEETGALRGLIALPRSTQ